MNSFVKEVKNGAVCSAKVGACVFVIYGALSVVNLILGAGSSKEEVETKTPEANPTGEPLEGAAK